MRRTLIITALVAVILAVSAWYFISPAFGLVPIKSFLPRADAIAQSEIYEFYDSGTHQPSNTLSASTLPWRLLPLLQIKKTMNGPYVFTDYVMDMTYSSDESDSSYHVYSHIRNGDVWFVDIVGDTASKNEISERKRLFQEAFPSLTVRARTSG